MNNQTKSDIIIYKDINGEIKLDVSLEDDTVWLSQKQMALLFDVNVPAINKHMKNILADGELNSSTISKMETVQKEGKREVKREVEFYNLDMIISLGYRVNSKRATKFVLDFNDCQKRPTTKRNRDKSDSKYLGGIDG